MGRMASDYMQGLEKYVIFWLIVWSWTLNYATGNRKLCQIMQYSFYMQSEARGLNIFWLIRFICTSKNTCCHSNNKRNFLSSEAQCQVDMFGTESVINKNIRLLRHPTNRRWIQRQPQILAMLEWRQLATNCKVCRYAASLPAPLLWCTMSQPKLVPTYTAWWTEARHVHVNNLPKVVTW